MVFSHCMRVKDSPNQYENIEEFGKEFDTYKVGTVANSTSTMHKLATTPITKDCFSFDNKLAENDEFWSVMDNLITDCERLRKVYLETKNKEYWRALIQILPSAWNQTRTVTMSYQNLRTMYFARRNHKLMEWRGFTEIVNMLPYAKELIAIEKNDFEQFVEKMSSLPPEDLILANEEFMKKCKKLGINIFGENNV